MVRQAIEREIFNSVISMLIVIVAVSHVRPNKSISPGPQQIRKPDKRSSQITRICKENLVFYAD